MAEERWKVDVASGVKRLVAMHAQELGLKRRRPADNCIRWDGGYGSKCEAGRQQSNAPERAEYYVIRKRREQSN